MINKRKQKNKAVILTSRKNHYVTAQPVIEELQKRDWEVRTLRFERVWERVENVLKTVKKSSIRHDIWNPQESKDKNYEKNPPSRYRIISRVIAKIIDISNIEKPNIVITMTDGPSLETIAIQTGRMLNIPSLLLQVGVIGPNYKCQNFLVDKIAIMGQFSKNVLVKCGVDESKLIVTGRPTYDVLARADEVFDKEKICTELGIAPGKKIILFATENLPPRERDIIFYAACRAINNLSDMDFVIKVHPAELDYAVYGKVANEMGLNPVVTKDINIYEVIYVCDAMITMFSTTALEAMILGKPVITVNLTDMKDPMPYAETGAAIGVYREKDSVPAIEGVLTDRTVQERLAVNRGEFVYAHAYKQDGKATERVANLIDKMIEKSKEDKHGRIEQNS